MSDNHEEHYHLPVLAPPSHSEKQNRSSSCCSSALRISQLLRPRRIFVNTSSFSNSVEVRLRKESCEHSHVLWSETGLFLSTLRAMDNLGLDIQQVFNSCFNGLTLDVFCAEQWGECRDLNPDQIKSVILDTTGFHGTM